MSYLILLFFYIFLHVLTSKFFFLLIDSFPFHSLFFLLEMFQVAQRRFFITYLGLTMFRFTELRKCNKWWLTANLACYITVTGYILKWAFNQINILINSLWVTLVPLIGIQCFYIRKNHVIWVWCLDFLWSLFLYFCYVIL